jgi:glycerol-3-phosphate acyltransferase PlsX
MIKIVIDIYGADGGAEPIVKGVAKALNLGVEFFPVLVGEKSLVLEIMNESGIDKNRYEVVDTNKFITNNDLPTAIFGGNDDTSMAMSYDRLKSDADCSALLSAGNTGALLVGSICRLGLCGGLKFPALLSALPCAKENLVCLVDCGANTECTKNDLARFAKMGNVFAKCYCGIESPRVGLMSVGREAQKGTALTKEAYKAISELDINFVGNLEGSDIVSGYADVIVADGFSGNILLKAAEAVGKAAMAVVNEVGGDSELAQKINEALYLKFDFNSRGAATFLGPKKTVVKMHGIANEDTTVASIEQILRLEKSQFSLKLAEAMSK